MHRKKVIYFDPIHVSGFECSHGSETFSGNTDRDCTTYASVVIVIGDQKTPLCEYHVRGFAEALAGLFEGR